MEDNVLDQGSLWEVFIQVKSGVAFKHAGSLHAFDAIQALEHARDVYTRRKEGMAIWVVPSDQIVASKPADHDAFFTSAIDKVYRHPTFYKMPEGAEHI